LRRTVSVILYLVRRFRSGEQRTENGSFREERRGGEGIGGRRQLDEPREKGLGRLFELNICLRTPGSTG